MMTVFDGGKDRRPQDFDSMPLSDNAALLARFGNEWTNALESMELATVRPPLGMKPLSWQASKRRFFGSGVNNFGVMEVLDALVDLAPSPKSRTSSTLVNRQPVVKVMQPEDTPFSGVVFKVQANMDANHRDRITACPHGLGQVHAGYEAQGDAYS